MRELEAIDIWMMSIFGLMAYMLAGTLTWGVIDDILKKITENPLFRPFVAILWPVGLSVSIAIYIYQTLIEWVEDIKDYYKR